MCCNTQNYWVYGLCPSFGIGGPSTQTWRFWVLYTTIRTLYFQNLYFVRHYFAPNDLQNTRRSLSSMS
jgi:hypothetical protein